MQASQDVKAINALVEQESGFVDNIVAEVGKVIIGQRYMVERMLIGLLCNGHCLIEGVPGLAKTLMIKTLAQTLDAVFQRVQFTPDLLPADITGTTIYNMQTATFTQKRGPIFAIARTAGWLAHWLEQLENNRIYRPAQIYEGQLGLTYNPIEKRG